MNHHIIRLEDVCYAYGAVIALRHIHLNVHAGEAVVLQGDNGCGKSTLMELLNGLIFPQQGNYFFDGMPVTERALRDAQFSKALHRRIGFIWQNADVQLFCSSVEEEIAFGPAQLGLTKAETVRRTDELIRLFSLEKLRERAPCHLSGGEKRKVALACILALNPDVLTLDEPMAGLDKKSQLWLTDFLLQLRAAGKTLIISTHSDQLARQLGTRFVTINGNHEIERDELC